jgi:hypothetical protein
MTGLLNDVMHDRADSLGAPELDLDTIVAAGDRRIRRGRVVTGLVAAAVAGTVVAGGLAVTSVLGPRDEPVPQAPVIERGPAYAIDRTVTVGAQSFTVPHRVTSLVQTDDGLLYTSPDGRVWLYDGTGSEHIGHAEGHRLRTDDTGSLAAWTDLAEDGHPQYVVFDTSTRSEVARVDDNAAGPSVEPVDRGAEVFAVDDGSVYWRHDSGLVRYGVESGDETVLSDAAAQIEDVAGGRVAYIVEESSERGWGIAVDDRIVPDAPPLAETTNGVLSPDGRLLAAEEEDTMAVYSTEDGEDVTPTVDGYQYVVGYEWVDDDVAAVLALSALGDSSVTGAILACDVSDDACTKVSSFEAVDSKRFVLAVGEPMS